MRAFMLNSALPPSQTDEADDDAVDAIVRSGPHGALWVAGVATALVLAMWAAFYLWVFLPRSLAP